MKEIVFPDPVWAIPTTSCPERAIDQALTLNGSRAWKAILLELAKNTLWEGAICKFNERSRDVLSSDGHFSGTAEVFTFLCRQIHWERLREKIFLERLCREGD
jgi:hypothetical protein